MTNQVLVSIAVAARNASRFIKEALGSVPLALGSNGSHYDYEILLADGASVDGTVAIAEAHPRVRVVSRSDGGIYDGMNRAISAARGEFLLILNSDDMLEPGGLSAAVDELIRTPSIGMCSGAVRYGRDKDTATQICQRGPLCADGVIFGVPAINARLYRRQLIEQAGPLRTDIGLGADREWLLRILKAGGAGAAIATPIYFYRQHQRSMTLANDSNSALRIYEADIELGRILCQSHDEEHRRLSRALIASRLIKLGLKDKRRGRQQLFSLKDLHLVPRDYVRGLYYSAVWRSHLSGA